MGAENRTFFVPGIRASCDQKYTITAKPDWQPTLSEFYKNIFAHLAALGIEVKIRAAPYETSR